MPVPAVVSTLSADGKSNGADAPQAQGTPEDTRSICATTNIEFENTMPVQIPIDSARGLTHKSVVDMLATVHAAGVPFENKCVFR
jgi:hypothetical protein